METETKKKKKISEEVWKSQLRNQVIFSQPFNIPFEQEEMERVVELAVRKVVYDRKRTYVRKYQEQIKLAANPKGSNPNGKKRRL